MRFIVWDAEQKLYQCNECHWKHVICTRCSDPAEKMEREFAAHSCQDYQRKAAA